MVDAIRTRAHTTAYSPHSGIRLHRMKCCFEGPGQVCHDRLVDYASVMAMSARNVVDFENSGQELLPAEVRVMIETFSAKDGNSAWIGQGFVVALCNSIRIPEKHIA